MHNSLPVNSVRSSRQSQLTGLSEVAGALQRGSSAACTDDAFIALLEAYRISGGLAPAREVRAQVARQCDTSLVMLANWIVSRQVICFVWHSRRWLPLFQFDAPGMTPKPGLADVLATLAPTYADWELAKWFVQPHPGLANRTPVATLGHNLSAVQRAANSEALMRH